MGKHFVVGDVGEVLTLRLQYFLIVAFDSMTRKS
ncbi:hypothetical protein DOFOFD_01805 [Acetobacteraceae bacterium EV16P]|uniref:Uncharacterized protein n=1 Tax=Sorlinia euscelidii TaxID=3081148 RepID=A0ABU7U1N3_9PROT